MIKTMALFALSIFLLVACGEAGDAQLEKNASNDTEVVESAAGETAGNDGLGVGPIKSVTIGDLDKAMAAEGETIFTTNCAACHKMDKRFVGPALAGVTEVARITSCTVPDLAEASDFNSVGVYRLT